MCDWYKFVLNLSLSQVDNPVSILNQDTSRNFLHSNKPSDKFKLFMKGTHLEQIAQDYSKAQEQQALLKEEIERKKGMLPAMEAKAKELEEEVEGKLYITRPYCHTCI